MTQSSIGDYFVIYELKTILFAQEICGRDEVAKLSARTLYTAFKASMDIPITEQFSWTCKACSSPSIKLIACMKSQAEFRFRDAPLKDFLYVTTYCLKCKVSKSAASFELASKLQ